MLDLEYKTKYLQSKNIYDKIEYLNMISSTQVFKELYLVTKHPYLKRYIINIARDGDIYNMGLKDKDDSIRIEVIKCIHSDLKAKWALDDEQGQEKGIKKSRKNAETQKKKEIAKKPKIVLAKTPNKDIVKKPEKICVITTAPDIISTKVPDTSISLLEKPIEEIKKQLESLDDSKPTEEKITEVKKEEIIKIVEESPLPIIIEPMEKVGMGSAAKIVGLVKPVHQVELIKAKETITAPVQKKKKGILTKEATNTAKVIRRPVKDDLLKPVDETIPKIKDKAVDTAEESTLEKQSKEMLANMLPEHHLDNIFDIIFLTRFRNKIQKRIDLLESNHSLLSAINKRKMS